MSLVLPQRGRLWRPTNTISITNTSTFLNTTNISTFSFASQSIGAAPGPGERRFVVVLVGTTNNVTGVPFSGDVGEVTFGGSNADAILAFLNSPSGNESSVIVALKEIPTGTTSTIAVNCDSGTLGIGGGVYRVITGSAGYAVKATATSTDVSSPVLTTSPSAADGDVGVACISNVNGGGFSYSAGWTKDYEVDPQSGEDTSGAHINFTSATSSLTISQTNNGDTAASAVVVLEPA